MNAVITTIDIETCPLEVYTWGVHKQYVSVDMIKTEWTILSFAAKPLNSKASDTLQMDTGGFGAARVRDDRDLCRDLHKVLDATDIVIAQNGVDFDIRKINARMAMWNLPPYSPVRVIDTKRVAQRVFGFTSNRLSWLSEHLDGPKKDEHPEFPGIKLWLECLKDNPKAWNVLRRYNTQDVLATEALYLRLLPWIPGHPNLVVYDDRADLRCPRCQSPKMLSRGWKYTQTGRYRRYRCSDCRGYASVRIREKDHELAKLVPT